jgi:sugar/nucleoside kinase (ribokinase family)
MTVDVACLGLPFLDLSLVGLPRLPRHGEEVFADDLRCSPGGLAITALAARRLGASVTVVSAVGRDWAGRLLGDLLAAEDIGWDGPETARGAVCIALGAERDRAMASYEPASPLALEHALALRPRALVTDLESVALVPDGTPAYAITGEAGAVRFAGAPPASLGKARAVLVNDREARMLTGQQDAEAGARALGELAATVVVTLGREGALALQDGELVHAEAPPVLLRSTLGAGDLLAGAFVVGDLEGRPLLERLQRAVAYASLATRSPSVVEGAPRRAAFELELEEVTP